MRAFLAFTAASLAIVLPAAPALAEPSQPMAFSGSDAPTLNRGRDGRRDGDRRDRRRRGDTILFYDRDYQGDTAWRSTSFNDWWHEKTERSYPRWMQNNAGCERHWYAGDTLRC